MNPLDDPVIKMGITAARNHWQCHGKTGFTWLAGENCPDYGSSDCPMTMNEDRPCNMTDERESQLISHRWKVKR